MINMCSNKNNKRLPQKLLLVGNMKFIRSTSMVREMWKFCLAFTLKSTVKCLHGAESGTLGKVFQNSECAIYFIFLWSLIL